MKHFDDINDDEIRIIGNENHPATPPRRPFWRRWWLWVICAVVWLFLALVIFFVAKGGSRPHHGGYDTEDLELAGPAETDAVAPTLVKSAPATVVERDTVVNDVPLRLRTPVNALPELIVGIPDSTDEHLVLVLQAADIRADNHGIVGAFVRKGELLSRGVAKRGFCAIIGRSMQLGMAESTPLFEEAINKEGYFFRQYPLVESGRMVENKPKGKALRHALCELDGRVVTVSSLDKESFHDFAQALEDLGVESALALTGGDAYGFLRNEEIGFQSWGDIRLWKNAPNVNFIVWRRAE